MRTLESTMAKVRLIDGVTLSHPRCGHGDIVIQQFESGALAARPHRQILPTDADTRAKLIDEKRAEAARLAGGEDWHEVLEPPCAACLRAGYGRRRLRPGEQVSCHAASGALRAK